MPAHAGLAAPRIHRLVGGLEPTQTVTASELKVPAPSAPPRGLSMAEIGLMTAASLLVLAASYLNWWTISATEAWGFATGGVCVWLVVREHLWNWPIGLANNVVFLDRKSVV